MRGVRLAKARRAGAGWLDAKRSRRRLSRIIIATARAFGYVLATRDAKILEYGAQGHVRVIGC